MMVFGHSHTGPVHGGQNSSRRELRDVQPIEAPHTKWTKRRGPDTGYCQSEGVIGGVTAGAGFGEELSPYIAPVEVHAEATNTETGVWFNVKDLVDFGRRLFSQ